MTCSEQHPNFPLLPLPLKSFTSLSPYVTVILRYLVMTKWLPSIFKVQEKGTVSSNFCLSLILEEVPRMLIGPVVHSRTHWGWSMWNSSYTCIAYTYLSWNWAASPKLCEVWRKGFAAMEICRVNAEFPESKCQVYFLRWRNPELYKAQICICILFSPLNAISGDNRGWELKL